MSLPKIKEQVESLVQQAYMHGAADAIKTMRSEKQDSKTETCHSDGERKEKELTLEETFEQEFKKHKKRCDSPFCPTKVLTKEFLFERYKKDVSNILGEVTVVQFN